MRFALEELTCGYRGKRVLSDISISVRTGDCLCVLGCNGVGKTTLFKSILGLLPLIEGRVTVDGREIQGLPARERARLIGYVPQAHVPPFPYTVLDIVVMGRVAHQGMFASPGKQDVEIARQTLDSLGILHLADCVYTQISGGERQMALIARALTQQPAVLLMDEPTANLDFANQARVLERVCRLTGQGVIVVMTSHSPDHALRCDAKVLLLEREGGHSFGTAQEMIRPEKLNRAYGVPVCITEGRYRNHVVRGCVPLIDADVKPDASDNDRTDQRKEETL